MLALHRFRQELVGSYRWAGGSVDAPLTLTLEAERPGLLRARLAVRGVIQARGLAERAELTGHVDLRAWATRPGSYTLSFPSDDRQALTLRGARRFSLRSPVFSSSVVDAEIVDATTGRQVATAELRLDYRQTIGRWLRL